MSTRTEATVEDLYGVPENGKAELVNGEIVEMPPAGGVSGRGPLPRRPGQVMAAEAMPWAAS